MTGAKTDSTARTSTAEIVATVGFVVLALAGLLSRWIGPLDAAVGWLADRFFFLIEAPFYFAPANETVLTIAALGALLTGAAGLARLGTRRLPDGPWVWAERGLWQVIAVSALVTELYVIAFAARTSLAYLGVLVVVAGLVVLLARHWLRVVPDYPAPAALDDAPWLFALGLVAGHLFLGLVMGHVATPAVHWLASWMAYLSAHVSPLYRAAVAAMLLAPALPWVVRLDRAPRALGIAAVALGVVALASVALPSSVSARVAGVAAAGALVIGAAAGGFPPGRLLHLSPRVLAGALLLPGLLALQAMTVHYATAMWRCPAEQIGVRQLTTVAGTFDLATREGGEQLLVSLREPRRMIEIDVATGAGIHDLDTSSLIDGTGHVFSWVEPETLLTEGLGARTLLLLAVSDDEESNRVAVLNEAGWVEGFVEGLPETSIADLIADNSGAVYASTEFLSEIYVLDPSSLEVTRRIHWPEAETNKIAVDPEAGKLFSLGLWWDPYLRAMDLASEQQIGALEVGLRSWDMVHDARDDRIYLPRLVEGVVLGIDSETLEVVERWDLGFGVRPIALDAELRVLYVGNMYQGTVTAIDLLSGRTVRVLHVGGYIKGLHVDVTTQYVYVGSSCGIFEIDPHTF